MIERSIHCLTTQTGDIYVNLGQLIEYFFSNGDPEIARNLMDLEGVPIVKGHR